MAEAAKAESKMFPVKLLRNYQPNHEYEVLGYLKPERKEKTASGELVTVDRGGWQEGVMHPAPVVGAYLPNKIWAGTTVKLPIDVAKRLMENKAAERADAIPD